MAVCDFRVKTFLRTSESAKYTLLTLYKQRSAYSIRTAALGSHRDIGEWSNPTIALQRGV